ncbi:MAG: hypothetical protein AAB074_02245 [Planctomycetota bacterium]
MNAALKFASIKSAAPLLDMTPDALRKAIRRGSIPASCIARMGRRTIRLDMARLTDWLRKEAQP